MAGIAARNHGAYDLLSELYKDKLWRVAVSVLRDPQEAEDVVQDILMMIWQSPEKWKADHASNAKLSSWLYRITFNKCLDVKKKQKQQASEQELNELLAQGSAYHDILQRQISDALKGLLNMLPELQRLALLFYYYYEMDVDEIGRKMNRSEDSVRSLIKRGKANLKEKAVVSPAFYRENISALLDAR